MFDGRANSVVQAGQLHGGVHIHRRGARGILAGAAGGLTVGLIILVATLLLLYWAYQHFFGTSKEDPPASITNPPASRTNLPASITGGGTYWTNHILKDNPYEAVRQVYQRIAEDAPPFACGVFTDEAARQFAEHFNAPDCPKAIDLLHAQVNTAPGSVDAYAEPDFHGKMGQKPELGTATVSSCELGVTSGPRLGRFIVSRVDKGQWIITGHQLEKC